MPAWKVEEGMVEAVIVKAKGEMSVSLHQEVAIEVATTQVAGEAVDLVGIWITLLHTQETMKRLESLNCQHLNCIMIM